MKLRLAIFIFAAAVSVNAQTTITPFQALHPILKDPNKRLAPSSLDHNQGLLDDSRSQQQPANQPTVAKPQIIKPAPVVAKIDEGLSASKITLVGTVKGLKGRIFVNNNGSHVVTPTAQFAVYDQRGMQIGIASADGVAVASGDTGKIEVLATNADAVNLQLVKLSAK